MKGRQNDNRLSKPIVIISLASIIIGIAVMIISVSVVKGFQNEIREKVIGFGAHIQVTKQQRSSSMESSAILINQEFYPDLEEVEGVKNIQIMAYKPALLQSFREVVEFDLPGNDTTQSTQDIMGVLFKGISEDYDWDFFTDKLIEGELIDFDSVNDQVLISKYISNKLGYKVGDQLDAHFIVDNRPKKRTFTVKGIYRTGFEEFDKQYIFTQIEHIQKLNKWGVQTLLTIVDTCLGDDFVLLSTTVGGNRNYRYNWGEGYSEKDYQLISGSKDTSFRVWSTDFEPSIFTLADEEISIADTAWATVFIENPCPCSVDQFETDQVEYLSDSYIKLPFGHVEIENGKSTHSLYTGGFEIILENWDELENMDDIIYESHIPNTLKTETIVDRYKDIFAWLDFLDINIVIILSLILVVSLINMVTSLLVIILEKTNMIGILKAMGASNSSIRNIFMYNSLFLLSRGLFWGNIIGIGLLLIQHYTKILTLDPEPYYLDYVPVDLSIWNIVWINILTVVVCRFTLIIPSMMISRIKPIKAIKFD